MFTPRIRLNSNKLERISSMFTSMRPRPLGSLWTCENRFVMFAMFRCEEKNVESVFDIMDLEDSERNEILELPDAKMQVYPTVSN